MLVSKILQVLKVEHIVLGVCCLDLGKEVLPVGGSDGTCIAFLEV